jgi:hypothetical protein
MAMIGLSGMVGMWITLRDWKAMIGLSGMIGLYNQDNDMVVRHDRVAQSRHDGVGAHSEGLEGNPNALPSPVESRSSTVPTVDSCVYLNAQQLSCSMNIGGHLYAGHHSTGHRHCIAANRIPAQHDEPSCS